MQSKQQKTHYPVLDGLRGVAALMVVGFHVFECYATDTYDQMLNHAYLAVDFFFMLSGFIVGHAYDDRWGEMTFFSFMKRRIFRLHPMVIFGTLLGTVLFYYGASPVFPLIASCPLWKLLLFALLSMLIIPTPKSVDIRGSYPETYNLDGPIWSLSWEYLANILYALFIRRFSKVALGILVAIAACSTAYLALTQGDVCGGWYLDGEHIYIGLTRLVFPFFGGLLLYRIRGILPTRNAFFWCSAILIVLFSVPRIGTPETVWQNGIFELAVIFISFPLVVAMGAGGSLKSDFARNLCRTLGDISYPVYLINYPICYVMKGWVSRMRIENPDFGIADNPMAPILLFIGITVFSYAVTKLYDIPVRKWLRKKL